MMLPRAQILGTWAQSLKQQMRRCVCEKRLPLHGHEEPFKGKSFQKETMGLTFCVNWEDKRSFRILPHLNTQAVTSLQLQLSKQTNPQSPSYIEKSSLK